MAKQTPSVFYFTDYLLIAYKVRKQQVIEVRRFHLNPEGQAEFGSWLPESGIKPIYHPVYIVVDSRLEEYQIDIVPHVRGSNRKDLLNHRLRRLYTNTAYTHATILGRVKNRSANGKRQDDHVLFTALNNAEIIQAWVRLLLIQRISIRGIYSLPLLTQQFIAKLDLPNDVLLVTHTEQVAVNNPQGLRQSFFHKGRLEASRLIPLPVFSQSSRQQITSKEDYSTYVNSEIHKTLQYLSGHALLKPDTILTILLFGEPQSLLQIKQVVDKQPQANIQFRFYPTPDFLEHNGLHQYPPPAYFHFLPVQHIVRGKTPNHYAQTGEIFYDTHLKIRQRIYFGSFVMLFLGLIFSGIIAYQAWQTQQQNTALQIRTEYLQAEEQKAKEHVGTGIAPRHMRNAVEAAQKLRNSQLKPHKPLSVLGQELKKFPELKLRSIKWEVREVANELEEKLSRGNSLMQARFLAKKRQSGQLDTSFEQVISIEGQVWSQRHKLPLAQRTFDSFLKRLRSHPNVTIDIQEQPIDPNKLTNVFSSQNNNKNANFELSLTFKLPHTNTKTENN